LEIDKNFIEKFSLYQGFVYKKMEGFQNWQEFYVILSGGYLYFYVSQNSKQFDFYL